MRPIRNYVFKCTRSNQPKLLNGLKDNKIKKSKKIWISPSRLYNFISKIMEFLPNSLCFQICHFTSITALDCLQIFFFHSGVSPDFVVKLIDCVLVILN